MPVLNGAKTIAETLRSVFSQSFSDFEFIISDNASTDGTLDVIESMPDPRVRLHRWDATVRGEINFNKCLELARGELFLWLACDDLWEEGSFHALVDKLRSEPSASLCFPRVLHFHDDEDGVRNVLNDYYHLEKFANGSWPNQLLSYLKMDGGLGKANLIYSMMRTEKIRQVGGMYQEQAEMLAGDVLTVAKLLTTGPAVRSGEACFLKRAKPISNEEWYGQKNYEPMRWAYFIAAKRDLPGMVVDQSMRDKIIAFCDTGLDMGADP